MDIFTLTAQICLHPQVYHYHFCAEHLPKYNEYAKIVIGQN